MPILHKFLLASALFIIPFLPVGISAPVITVWYGDTQSFGNIGEPQSWCNIPGNVSAAGGLSSVYYTLNGGSQVALSVGPDNRRLENTGDFNVDLAVADLVTGSNTVVITAIDNSSNQIDKTVTVNYTPSTVWPNPYSVDWSTIGGINAVNNVAHVVDGKFALTTGGIRTTEPGYDRLIALGDVTWQNYEVLVPITIHDMPSNAGVGVLLRWTGHTDSPVVCAQPKCGWLPLGDIAWYRPGQLEFYEGGSVSRTLSNGVTYWLRTAVETDATAQTTYRLRVWEQGTTEPTAWDLEKTTGPADEQVGSLLLIAHQADVTFGDVTISPGALSISNIQVQLANNNTEATITWNTNQPASSRVDYGLTTGYEGGFVADATLKTSHSLTLTGLTTDEIYNYQITSENAVPETISSGNRAFSTYSSNIVSDDFCDGTLDPVWTFDNPLGDGSYGFTGSGTADAWLEISVPAGSEHEMFTNGIEAPNLLQTVNNADFEVEVKFESPVETPQYQEQGILVKESDTRYLRFEFFSKDPDDTFIYAQGYDLPTATAAFANTSIGADGTAPLYMRVKRQGTQWTQMYSFDGTNWSTSASFIYDLTPTMIGPYAGNAVAGNSPAHLAQIDYFENLAAPIVNEDGCTAPQPPVLSAIGDQNVEENTSLTVNLSATDPDGSDAALDFTEAGLPTFAALTDNGDGTAVLQIHPLSGNAGAYTLTITVTDGDGLSDSETLDIFVYETGLGPSNLRSDDFCTGTLGSQWTFVNPKNDGSLQFSGANTADAWVELSVPAETEHQVWIQGIQAAHILQSANDTDFAIEVSMESPVNTPQFQMQGIVIKQDDYNFLRFEVYSTNSNTSALGAILQSANPSFPVAGQVMYSGTIEPLGTAPILMRVRRVGNQWTQERWDGSNWQVIGTLTHELRVSAVGLYGGNGTGGGSPAHTAQFDYFISLDNTIVEDACAPLPVELIAFQARAERQTVHLTWTTASEKDNDYFAVEHSTDGRRFRTIGTVAGALTTELTTSYRFVHEGPASGDNYYRLRQVDLDGTTSYSWIESARIDFKGILSVFPNPATSIVNIRTSEALLHKRLKIFNALGGLYYSGPIQRDLLRVDIAPWPPGVYSIQVEGDSATAAYRFVVE